MPAVAHAHGPDHERARLDVPRSPGGGLAAWPLLAFHLLLAVKLVSVWARVDPIVESGYSALAFLGFVAFEDGCVLGLLVLVLLVRGRPRLSGAAAGAVLAVYGLDVALQHALFARLTLPNLVQYAGEVRFAAVVATPAAVLVALVVSVGSWSLRRRRVAIPAPRVAVPLALALVLLPSLAARLRLHDPYLELAFSNVARSNWQLLGSRGVPEETFERARERHPALWARLVGGGGAPAGSPAPPRRARPNLIVVVSESLSRVDSRRSGGLFDRLPRHDAAAARGATFTGLVSDGSNTTDALAALLAGEDPLPTPGVFASMAEAFPRDPEGAHGASASLVTVARQRGYATRFLSNAPLRFQDNGRWLRRLGFGLVEGGEAAPYRARRGYSFGAAPDEALYDRAAEVLAAGSDRPLLLVLLTVSLHAPYRTPVPAAGEGSLTSALRYVDGAAGRFFDELERSGYFESGYLLVVGDHRRMTPLEPEERRAFGLDALGRVFGCLVGPGVPEGLLVEAPLNHGDLHAVAADLLAGTFSPAAGFDAYNKGRRYGLGLDFITHVVDGGRGLVLVRRAGRPLYTVRLPGLADRLEAGAEEDRRIAAYLAVGAGLLERRREPPPPSACPPPEAGPLALRRCETLQRLFQTQRYLASAAPVGFAYDPERTRAQVEGVFEAAAAGTDGWRRAGSPAALALLSRLSALDAGAPRAAWLQGTYDLIAVTHAFEVLTHDQAAGVAAAFPALDHLSERGRIVALWAGIRRTFRDNLEAPRDLPAGPPPRDAGSAPSAVVAHQGGLSRWPPSSLPALRRARDLGADGIEIDLRLAGDGEVFVLHDGLVARPGEPGAAPVHVSRTPSLELRRLRLHHPFALDRPSGQPPIALRDVLRGLGGDLLLWLELKPDGGEGLPEAVGDLLAERPELLGSMVVSSLAPRMVQPLRARFPELLVAYESGAIDPAAVEALAASPDADRLIVSSYHFQARSPEAFRRAQDLGLRTSSFTVNRFDELAAALAAGVTYIQTDRPDRALWLRAQAPGGR